MSRTKQTTTNDSSQGNDSPMHIYPLGDTFPHTLYGLGCDCHPAVSPNAGSSIILHNSFDGREIIEQHSEIKSTIFINLPSKELK